MSAIVNIRSNEANRVEHHRHQDTRNKYNTLTPAEAKRLNRYLNGGKRPIRTASVLNKPRAPPAPLLLDPQSGQPIPQVVGANGNVNSKLESSPNSGGGHYGTLQPLIKHTAGGSLRRLPGGGRRCVSSCSNSSGNSNNNHSSSQDQRYSPNYGCALRSAASRRYAFADTHQQSNTNKLSSRASPNNNNNNNDSDSNLSFRSSLDIVDSAYGSDRLQTMSVDLGKPNSQQHYYGTLQRTHHIYSTPPKTSNNHHHASIESRNLQDSNRDLNESFYSAKSDFKSASKVSLTSSTSKVLKDQFTNFKKFFRINPMRKSFLGNNAETSNKPLLHPPPPPASEQIDELSSGSYNQSSTLCDENSLSDYISNLGLDRSQSPPVCPPPPGKLKSMLYMESNLDYSNYDEFTSLRNQRTSALLMNNIHRVKNNHYPNPINNNNNNNNNNSGNSLDDNEQQAAAADCWQMTSLPVAYERNLTTVIEERQAAASDQSKQNKSNLDLIAPTNLNANGQKLIKPPEDFVDKAYNNNNITGNMSHTSSNQSLTSVTTTDSVLDFHRQTATAFRFSYGQPNATIDNGQQHTSDASLPPRMPTTTTTYEPAMTATDYGYAGGCLDSSNDADTTLMSDTSTLHGDSGRRNSSKCAELQRTIESLKDKLIGKEKELTDLQLKQWSSDYLIDQLKSTIGRLEKENAQLKKNVMINVNNRVNL